MQHPHGETPFLLEPKFNFNPLLQQTSQLPPLRSSLIKLSYGGNNALKLNYPSYKLIRYSPKVRIKCFFMSPKSKGVNGIGGNGGRGDDELKADAISSGRHEVLWRSIITVLMALQKRVITGVLLGLLLLYDHQRGCVALAASGGRMGRMGGSSFSSSSSSSRSPSFSSSSSSSSTTPSSFSSSSSTTPSSYSSSSWSSSTSPESSFSSSWSSSVGVPPAVRVGPAVEYDPILFIVFTIVGVTHSVIDRCRYLFAEKTSVLKLQVGLLGTGKSLQRDLNRIAESADTSSRRGLSNILQETTLAILRHPDYCISGYSSVNAKRSIMEVEKLFNQLCIEERGKFDEETLVNVNNVKKQSATTQRSNGFPNEYIVITIIVAAEGIHKLPPIKSSSKLKEALQKLGSIPSSRVKAVEVLWTPQNENDTLTERDLLEHYSLLRPL